jgi:ABC-type branched-subunit amino acid transport system substrate-binding protein
MKRVIAAIAALGFATASPAWAQKNYGPGVTDTEIKIGQTMPYSGPASAYGSLGRTMVGYFKMINDQGGINGRKINMISLDDGYVPAKTLESTRRLVEQDEVLVVTGSVGTPTNSAVHAYLNQKKVPQLFVNTGAGKWNDPKGFPWTTGWAPTYPLEGRVFAEHILRTNPNAKIAILYQNDDFGKDYLKGVRARLGDKAKAMIVAEASFEVTDPTIDSQILSLKASGADTFINAASPKFATQAIRRIAESGWNPGRSGPLDRPAHHAVHEGLQRQAVGQRSRHAGLQGLHEEVLPGRRHRRSAQRAGLRGRAIGGARAERGG